MAKLPLESALVRAVRAALELEGAYVWKCHGGMMQAAGMPDLYVAHRKFHGWLELKRELKKSAPKGHEMRQRIRAQQLLARGVPVFFLGWAEKGLIEGQVWRQDDGAWRTSFAVKPTMLLETLSTLSAIQQAQATTKGGRN